MASGSHWLFWRSLLWYGHKKTSTTLDNCFALSHWDKTCHVKLHLWKGRTLPPGISRWVRKFLNKSNWGHSFFFLPFKACRPWLTHKLVYLLRESRCSTGWIVQQKPSVQDVLSIFLILLLSGLHGSTLSSHCMTTGFGPFEVLTYGLLTLMCQPVLVLPHSTYNVL